MQPISKNKRKKILENFGDEFIFLPDATLGTVHAITTKQLENLGYKGLVTNTLHLWIRLGPDKIKKLGGMHNLMNWDNLILTDSGGFQVFSLIHNGSWDGEIYKDGARFKSPIDGATFDLTPERSIDIQMALDSDVLVVLDDCRDAEISREQAELSVDNTIKWAERCKKHFDNEYGGRAETGKMLSCVIQGANFVDLRIKCAKALSDIGFDGYNFGGYVVDKDGNLAIEAMQAAIDNTPDDKFHYAMGVGKPEDIIAGAKLGYKVFDTVLVTRNARHGTLYSFEEVDKAGIDVVNDDYDPEMFIIRIKNSQYKLDSDPIDSSCDCPACQNYSRAYIRHLFKVNEITALHLMTVHNLKFYQRLIDRLNGGNG